MFVCFLSHSNAGALFVQGGHTLNAYVTVDFSSVFTLFQKELSFQKHSRVLNCVARWCHNFCEIAIAKIVKTTKIGKKVCALNHV